MLPPAAGYANVRSTMVVCVLFPRFALTVAAGGREALAAGPVALAPELGREQLIGEASAAAEAYGVRAGLRLGEALARCPTLRLVTPDPAGVADAWDRVLAALEGIGAAVEASRPGSAWFESRGLERLHGDGVEGVVAVARKAVGARAARFGAAPSRFAAHVAASRARARRPEIAPAGPARLAAYLAPAPVSLLAARPEVAVLPDALERFGVRTLGELAAMPRAALADRFGAAGVLGHELARGKDTPLRPRTASERLEEVLELPETASGPQLEQALGLLIDRLLARRERRGRTLRAVVLSAALVGGGTWRVPLTFREPLADPRRMRLVLVQRLADLPAPADVLRLRAEGFGPAAGDQRSLLAEAAAVRAARLREAVRQARSVAGPEAALRILAVDPDSRVPERRLALAPWDP
jgi:nucleotidyltransferase/DNA polymerase involved in DNA repair